MKILGKLARSLAARYVCQTCEKEKERRAVAHNATKCLERNTLLAESNQAAASATGDLGAASATGYQGAASATGDQAAASATGKAGVALAAGYECKAMGALGCAICCVERGEWDGETFPIIAVKAAIVDGEKIKADTWYRLKNGEFEEVE